MSKNKQENKKKVKPELDTETTFADMNVEGFRWYDPSKKAGAKQTERPTKKEYRSMIKGAFLAILPPLLCIICGMGLIFCLMYLWLM